MTGRPSIKLKAGFILLSASGAETADEFEVGPCELFGFGLGSYSSKDLEEARSAPLPCLLEHDCTLVVHLPEDGAEAKYMVPLATALFGCERHAGIADVSVQGHTLSPNGSFPPVQREARCERALYGPP